VATRLSRSGCNAQELSCAWEDSFMEGGKSWSKFCKTWFPIMIGVGGLLVGAAPFFYQNFIEPAHAARTLAITTTLEKVGETDSLVALKGTLRMKNITKTRVEVLAGYYNVIAMPVTPAQSDVAAFRDMVKKDIDLPQFRTFAYHFSEPNVTVVFAGKLFDESDKAWWDPELDYSREFHVFLPRGRYSLTQMTTVLYYAKDRKSASTKWSVGDDGSISAAPCRKLAGFDKDATKCEAIDGTTPEGYKLWQKFGLDENDAVSELSLIPSVPAHAIAR
jgi:hypothetical protein